MIKNLRARKRKNTLLQVAGIASLCFAVLVLCILIGSIIIRGYSAFTQSYITLDLPAFEGKDGEREWLLLGLEKALPLTNPVEKRMALKMLSLGATDHLKFPIQAGTYDILLADHIHQYVQHNVKGRISNQEVIWLDTINLPIKQKFAWHFFTNADSRQAELAGIGGALLGSIYTLIITLIVAFPIGVAAALYLEEFAKQGRLTSLIEVNINNLAAVPSIIYGLFGLALFLNFGGFERSTPLVGGLVLGILTLPTVIIASRVAIQAVPDSMRYAALGMGASKVQMVLHHVLPYSLPGVLTGVVIGIARALGETAPLLMIGMVAFIASPPSGLLSPSTALPVQIFLWADSVERGFVGKTAAAILVLLFVLILLNWFAMYLRKKLEIIW